MALVTAKLPFLWIFNSEATKIITWALLYAVHSIGSFTSVLICPKRQAASAVKQVVYLMTLYFMQGAPIVIDVARLRVIRQSVSVCLFV